MYQQLNLPLDAPPQGSGPLPWGGAVGLPSHYDGARGRKVWGGPLAAHGDGGLHDGRQDVWRDRGDDRV
jgi:hypothetical protein